VWGWRFWPTFTSQAINYLIFGKSLSELDHPTEGCANELFEDTMLFVKKDAIHLFCEPRSYPALLQCTGSWRNMHVNCTTAADADDDDLREAYVLANRSFDVLLVAYVGDDILGCCAG
jgi:hypothetical protein